MTGLDKAAREYCKQWPEAVYHPNDLTVFFQAGANWMQEKNAKEIEQLKQRLEIAVEALKKIDRSNDDMKYFNIDVHNIIRETLTKISAEK